MEQSDTILARVKRTELRANIFLLEDDGNDEMSLATEEIALVEVAR
jgi:hypothetical protein